MHKRLVMVLEDEISISTILAYSLRDMNYEVGGPFRGNQQAETFLRSARPDAALLDFNVADGTCSPTAKRLNDLRIPFVILSAYPKKLARGNEFADVPWLAKPFRLEELEDTLAALTGGTGAPATDAAAGNVSAN